MVDIIEELTKQYKNTYVKHTSSDGEVSPLYITGFTMRSNSTIKVYGIFNHNDADNSQVPLTELDLSFPELGLFNVENFCINVIRSASRQWKRAINKQVAIVNSVNQHEMRYLDKSQPALTNPKVLKAIFIPEYPSPEEALNDVIKFKRLSRAFNSRWYISNQINRLNPIVGFKGQPIGWVDSDNIISLPPPAHHLFEELSDYLQCRRIE